MSGGGHQTKGCQSPDPCSVRCVACDYHITPELQHDWEPREQSVQYCLRLAAVAVRVQNPPGVAWLCRVVSAIERTALSAIGSMPCVSTGPRTCSRGRCIRSSQTYAAIDTPTPACEAERRPSNELNAVPVVRQTFDIAQ